MPNPGAMVSLQAFERDHVNTAIPIADYKLRRTIALQRDDELVMEAFTAFDELFHLHLKWSETVGYPELTFSSISKRYQRLVLDVTVQSSHFTYCTGAASPQWASIVWSTTPTPVEVYHVRNKFLLHPDKSPSFHNDANISFDQTVTFSIVGTLWKLDDDQLSSLQCRSYRTSSFEASSDASRKEATTNMVECIAAMRDASDTHPDIRIILQDEDEDSRLHVVHAFILQAQSPVFRRMLHSPMTEASNGEIVMAGVTAAELDDFLAALYGLSVPTNVQEDTDRLLAMLGLADRYGVTALRDECAKLLESRLNETNMASLLESADLHQATTLREAALRFITQRMDWTLTVMDTDNQCVRKVLRDHLEEEAAQAEAANKAQGAQLVCEDLEITV